MLNGHNEQHAATPSLLHPLEEIMTRLFVAAVVAVCAIPGLASAQLAIKNVRPCYGPNGPTRTDATCLPRDTLFITYEIEGLKPHEKSKKVEYKTTDRKSVV